jgi:hypothetical protein
VHLAVLIPARPAASRVRGEHMSALRAKNIQKTRSMRAARGPSPHDVMVTSWCRPCRP